MRQEDQSLAAVEVLLFDGLGTVVDWRTSITNHLARFGLRHSIQRDWAAFADLWWAAYQPSLELIRSRDHGYLPLDDLHRRSLPFLLDRFHIADLDGDEIVRLASCWHRLRPWPDTVPALDRLADRAMLVSVSNAGTAMSVDIARYAGFRWQATFGAEMVGTYLPDPAIYRKTLSSLDLLPHQAMMVSTDADDLTTASRLGLRTTLLAREAAGRRAATTSPPTGRWDLVCSDLTELADALDSGRTGSAVSGEEDAGSGSSNLSRVRAVSLVATMAVVSALAFNSGYQLGRETTETPPTAAVASE